MTFNLKEERAKIEKASKTFADTLLIKDIFLNIRKQDAEFIRKIKLLVTRNFYNTRERLKFYKLLDKLAGEKFQ